MGTIETGLIASASVVLCLWLLFRFENTRGERVIENYRSKLDFFVLDLTHRTHVATQIFLKQILRQSAHFLFHAVLKGLLVVTEGFGRNVRHMMRTNKTRSKKVEQESKERNKLEEIALHKMAVSLTEEEKNKRKEDVLNE